jgi:hypothetical protein
MSGPVSRPSRETLEHQSFVTWFSDVVADFGESMPDAWVTHPNDRHKSDDDPSKRTRPLIFLHCGIFQSKQAVFRDFHDRGIITAKVKESTLRTWWKALFWHIKVKKWQNFAKCDQCTTYRTQLYAFKGEYDKAVVREQRDNHRSQVSLGRKRFALREEMAIAHPEIFLHVSIDAMDNKKTNVPQAKSMANTKSSSNAGEALKTRLMGALNKFHVFFTWSIVNYVMPHSGLLSAGRGFIGYWCMPRYDQGLNLTLSCLLHFFHIVLEHEGDLPPVLFLQMDNAAKENKNMVRVLNSR